MTHARGTEPRPPSEVEGVAFRRPTEADYAAIAAAMHEWFPEPRAAVPLPRLWLRHFTSSSWLAESDDGSPAGFLVGFLSPDRRDEACCHVVATAPSRRREGIGRALYERFLADARAGGRSVVTAAVWPANRACLRFHESLGFEADAGPDTQRLYGTPAYPAYDDGTEDRAVLRRRV